MNGNQSKIITEGAGQPFLNVASGLDWRNAVYKTGIVAAGLAFVFFLILLKSKTTAEFQAQPSLFTYAVFVTAFTLSRIISAMFYKSSFRSLLKETASNDLYPENYEPEIAFVIPCKNEEKNIAAAITNCYKTDYPREKLEVIVVNDGSNDGTRPVLEQLKNVYPDLKIINWSNQGKKWAMAAGFKISRAQIVVQLDSDSQVDPGTFKELIRPFRNPKVAAVCAHGIPKNADKNLITRMQTAYYFMSFRILKAAESSFDTVFCCSGCCSAYRRNAVMPVLYEWLAESFLKKPVTWGDDRALTSWLLKNGGKTVYASKAVAYTVVPETWRQLLKQQLRWKKSWIVNSMITSRFIFKKQAFVAFFYYFPLVLISFLTPFMSFRALVYGPLVKGTWPLFYIAGILLITTLMVIYYRYIEPKNKYWLYLFPWAILNMFVLCFLIVWAAIRVQDRGWGTR